MADQAADGQVNVLSIDGGGVRGIIPAYILDYIAGKTQKPIHQLFDVIAGTSTGGIIALGLGINRKGSDKPYTPADLLDLYVSKAAQIFPRSMFSRISMVFGPKYSPEPLEKILAEYFPDPLQMKDAVAKLVIASFDLVSQQPFFFKSEPRGKDMTDWPAQLVARATSAAPTFFPPKLTTHGGLTFAFVDGGVCANNPAMAAYAEARRVYGTERPIYVLAVGTGDRHDPINYKAAEGWGLMGWANQLVPLFMDSVSEAVDYELSWSIRGDFDRLQSPLDIASPEMDDASPENIERLKQQAQTFINKNEEKIDGICTRLLRRNSGKRYDSPALSPATPVL